MTPTAEEFLNGYVDDFYEISTENIPNVMIEFAKFHVTEALKKANRNTKTGVRDSCGDIQADLVEKYILSSYSLDGIV